MTDDVSAMNGYIRPFTCNISEKHTYGTIDMTGAECTTAAAWLVARRGRAEKASTLARAAPPTSSERYNMVFSGEGMLRKCLSLLLYLYIMQAEAPRLSQRNDASGGNKNARESVQNTKSSDVPFYYILSSYEGTDATARDSPRRSSTGT